MDRRREGNWKCEQVEALPDPRRQSSSRDLSAGVAQGSAKGQMKAQRKKESDLPVSFPEVSFQRQALVLNAMPFERWLELGKVLGQIEGAVQFWIGDWWAYGQHRYRARSQAAKDGALGDRAFSTLANYGWVARAFKTSDRSEVLSWKHHQVLAHLPPDERLQWLRRAESEHWSVSAMLDAMAKPRPALETDSNASVAVSTAPISNEPDHHIEQRPAPHCDDRLPKIYSRDDALLTNLNSACRFRQLWQTSKSNECGRAESKRLPCGRIT